MMKKIIDIALKAAVGCCIVYFALTAVILPLAVKFGGESIGTKVLRHPVKVAWAAFNPLLWRLDVGGVKVLDTDGKEMAAFDLLDVDVSFVALFRKECRVESVTMDGLRVNAVLSEKGEINLMGLVPPPEPVAAVPEKKPGVPASVAPLPLVIVDLIALKNSQVNFLDRSIHPNFLIALHDIDVRVTDISTKADGQAKLVFKSKLGPKGGIDVELNVKPMAQPIELETSFAIDGFALDALSPYVGKYTGRALKDGALEFKTDYRIAGNKLMASHKVLIQRFEFGQKVESKDALALPFGLAVALLEDAQGRIKISLPVTGDMSKPDFHYWSLVGKVVTNFFTGLVTKPFSFLASALGADSGTDELGFVKFLPGKADIPDAEKDKIRILLRGLSEHPKLKLQVNGGYDQDADWKAIKAETLAKDYAEVRRDSTRSDSWIYQMLFQRRMGVRELWDVTKKFKVKEGEYHDEDLAAELKRLLIENGVPDKPALEALAAARAKVVYDFIVAAGLDAARLSVGPNRQEQASMGLVPLEFTLTVFEDEKL